MWLSLHMVQVCIQSLNMDNNFLQNIISRKTRKGSRKWLFWYGWGIWLYGWGEYCYWDVKIVKQFHYAPLNPIQNKQLWLEFAALNFILLQSFTSYANFFGLISLLWVLAVVVTIEKMEKYEEEEIPLLDLETGLDSEDAQSYFEAFKEFDHKNTGHISIRVHS